MFDQPLNHNWTNVLRKFMFDSEVNQNRTVLNKSEPGLGLINVPIWWQHFGQHSAIDFTVVAAPASETDILWFWKRNTSVLISESDQLAIYPIKLHQVFAQFRSIEENTVLHLNDGIIFNQAIILKGTVNIKLCLHVTFLARVLYYHHWILALCQQREWVKNPFSLRHSVDNK